MLRPLALLLALPVLLMAGEAAPPTAEEVLLLDLLNQYRENPANGELQVVSAIRNRQVAVDRQSWKNTAVTAGRFPPVVSSPQLTEAARGLLHARTMPAGKTRFDAAPALRAAGYQNEGSSLAMFATDSGSLAVAHAALYTNCLAEIELDKAKHYFKQEYAGPLAITGKWREAGVAVSVVDGKYQVVMILGQGTAKRHLGGIVFTDANRDGRYDPGEGRVGVKVSCGSARMTTGIGGAWWLASDTLDQGSITFEVGGCTAVRPVAKDDPTVVVHWRVPIPADLKMADRLIADAEKALTNPDVEKQRGALSALLVGVRMMVLDDARGQQVAALVGPIRDQFDLTLERALAAIGEDPDEFKARLAEMQKPWKGAMPAWFKEVAFLSRMRQEVNAVVSGPAGSQGRIAPPLIKQLNKALADTRDPAFLELYRNWKSSLDAVVAKAATSVK